MKTQYYTKLKLIHSLLLLFLFCTAINVIQAQVNTENLWNDINESSILGKTSRQIVPSFYRTLGLNVDGAKEALKQAPMEFSEAAKTVKVVFSLPMPDGTFSRFNILESPIMEEGLAVKFPEIKTYLGVGIDDPTATVRFDLTPAGFHAMILSSNGTVFIDPYSKGNISNYISYYKKDFIVDESRRKDFMCYFDPDADVANEIKRLVATASVPQSGTQLRTYRLAVATTGEYTLFQGGTVSAALAAVVTTMNRVDGVYEKEVAIRMVLVANNNLIIYTNSSTDPYTNNNGSTMLGQNQTNLDAVIGTANYDIGHVFSTGGGGVAYLGCVCQASNKAGGVTGSSAPIGDAFDIDYVAHEMGHQFGANHSFNGTTGSCTGGNRNASTAYEPGSGTTIMCYAGICSPQDIQPHSDDYFHLASIIEIVTYTTTGAGNSCPVTTTTGNNPPVVNAGTRGYTIPISTPFALTGSATDPDGDPLTYCWEEYDLGAAGAPNSPAGTAPIFRSFKGTSSPTRTFPIITDIINNTQTMGEILPSYTRGMKFRLTARDNRSGGGGIAWDSISFNVTSTAGPFQVTAPNTAVSWAAGSTQTVTWNVASTNVSPVSCSNVKILLSTDGGYTYPTVVLASTPNDGTENITVPNSPTSQARIRVEAVGNIFFDISNVNFTITQSALSITAPNGGENWVIGTNQTITWSQGTVLGNVKLEYTTDGSNFSTIIASTANNGSYLWTIPNTPSSTVKIRISDVSNSSVNDLSDANFTIGVPDVTPPVISNVQATSILTTSAVVTWTTDESSSSTVNYGLTQSYGSSATGSGGVTSHSVSLSGLSSNTTYHYQVQSTDASSNTTTDIDRTFQTQILSNPTLLGLDGGLEGTATIDNTTIASAGGAGKWQKANSTQTISLESSTVRSGSYSLRILNTSTTGRRVYTPLLGTVSDGSRLVLQYYRRTPSGTGQQNQHGIAFPTESLNGSYTAPASADTWEKQTYVPTTTTATGNKWAVIMHRLASGGSSTLPEYIDDLAVYVGTAVDNTAPDPVTSPIAAKTSSPSELSISWTAPITGIDDGGYLVIRRTGLTPTGTPNVNGIYAVGNTIGDGTVVYVGTSNTFTDTGLNYNNTYYYKVFTYDKAYNYSAGISTSEAPLPIQLASFVGSYVGSNTAKLEWQTISETNNYGFNVQRLNETTNNYETIGFVAGNGTTLTPESYSYIDDQPGKSYRLEQIDNDGLKSYFGPIMLNPSSVADNVPLVFKLSQNYPNPFNPTTNFSFSLANAGHTTLKVYNLIGKEVATLFNGNAEAGKQYVVNFDAKNLTSGIYFYKLQSGNKVDVKKLTLVK
jgi:hypothetical protein